MVELGIVGSALKEIIEAATANPLVIARIFMLLIVTLTIYEVISHLLKKVKKHTAIIIGVLFGALVTVFMPPQLLFVIGNMWMMMFALAMLAVPLAALYGIYTIFPKAGTVIAIIAFFTTIWISGMLNDVAKTVPAMSEYTGWIKALILLVLIVLLLIIIHLLGGIETVKKWLKTPTPAAPTPSAAPPAPVTPVTPAPTVPPVAPAPGPAPAPPGPAPPGIPASIINEAKQAAQQAAQAEEAAAEAAAHAENITRATPTNNVKQEARMAAAYAQGAKAYAKQSAKKAGEVETATDLTIANKALEAARKCTWLAWDAAQKAQQALERVRELERLAGAKITDKTTIDLIRKLKMFVKAEEGIVKSTLSMNTLAKSMFSKITGELRAGNAAAATSALNAGKDEVDKRRKTIKEWLQKYAGYRQEIEIDVAAKKSHVVSTATAAGKDSTKTSQLITQIEADLQATRDWVDVCLDVCDHIAYGLRGLPTLNFAISPKTYADVVQTFVDFQQTAETSLNLRVSGITRLSTDVTELGNALGI